MMNWGADRKRLDLGGAGVLITRPREQAGGIESLVTAHGGEAFVFPTLEIVLSLREELEATLSHVQAGDILIFVSTNAVLGVFNNISEALRTHLASAQIAAIGERTQAALDEEGLFVAIAPDRKHQTTEGLLKHPLLQDLRGHHVHIVRAQDGRPTLGEELLKRGAKLEYIQAYQRVMPEEYDAGPIIKALREGRIRFVLLTSFEAYENLVAMLGDDARPYLLKAQLIVPSERIANRIVESHPFTVSVARNASDEAMLEAMDDIL